jgi:hypothetical protein
MLEIDEGLKINDQVKQTALFPEFSQVVCIEYLETVVHRVLIEEFAHTQVLTLQLLTVLPKVNIKYLPSSVLIEIVLAIGPLYYNRCLTQFAVLVTVNPTSADTLQTNYLLRKCGVTVRLETSPHVALHGPNGPFSQLITGIGVGSQYLILTADLREKPEKVGFHLVLASHNDLHPTALNHKGPHPVNSSELTYTLAKDQPTEEGYNRLQRFGHLETMGTAKFLLYVTLESGEIFNATTTAQMCKFTANCRLHL